MSNIRLAALALAAITLGASSCGNSTKSPSIHSTASIANTSTPAVTVPPLTQAQLAIKAEAICKRIYANRRAHSATTIQRIALMAPEIAAYDQGGANELSKLVAPHALESDWKQFVTAIRTAAINTAKYGEYASSGNIAATGKLIRSDAELQKHATGVARRLGIDGCESAF